MLYNLIGCDTPLQPLAAFVSYTLLTLFAFLPFFHFLLEFHLLSLHFRVPMFNGIPPVLLLQVSQILIEPLVHTSLFLLWWWPHGQGAINKFHGGRLWNFNKLPLFWLFICRFGFVLCSHDELLDLEVKFTFNTKPPRLGMHDRMRRIRRIGVIDYFTLSAAAFFVSGLTTSSTFQEDGATTLPRE